MELTEEERRVLLDLIDEEHSRDRRTNAIGRTDAITFSEQTILYHRLRRKIVAAPLVSE